MEYTKPFLTYEQQADLLMAERGMQADRESLIRHLQDVGYYRLSGYWHIFKKDGGDEFWEGTTFDRVWSLMIPNAREWHEPFEVRGGKIFGALTVMSYLLERVAPDTAWRDRLLALAGGLTDANKRRMGFEAGWQMCPMWARWAPSEVTASEVLTWQK